MTAKPGPRSAGVAWLRNAVRRLRRLFDSTRHDEDRLRTEGGRIQTARLDLSDETIVQRLLDTSGGRIRQSSVIEQTDWSAAKVSRLLTSMEKRGDIERVRVGRQKVVVDERPEE